jgi:hypothetical protein
MSANYDIFKEESYGSFVWVESAEDIGTAKQRLGNLLAKAPAKYRLWDSSLHKFINPLAKSA